jgi:hypothetical protein
MSALHPLPLPAASGRDRAGAVTLALAVVALALGLLALGGLAAKRLAPGRHETPRTAFIAPS